MKEATARIKINQQLEMTGWRFFADASNSANIQLEPSVTLKEQDLEALGDDFEQASKGFVDFLLLNEKGFPLVVLEAKAEDKNPLVGKEQARNMPSRSTAASSFFLMATCIIFGICNAAILISSRPFRRRNLSTVIKRSRPTRSG